MVTDVHSVSEFQMIETLRFSRLNERTSTSSQFEQSFSLAKALQGSGTELRHMMPFCTTSWSEHGLKMELSCYQRMLHVQSIDDFLITTT